MSDHGVRAWRADGKLAWVPVEQVEAFYEQHRTQPVVAHHGERYEKVMKGLQASGTSARLEVADHFFAKCDWLYKHINKMRVRRSAVAATGRAPAAVACLPA